MSEATITVNGILLTEAQALSVRMAVEFFLLTLNEPSELWPVQRMMALTQEEELPPPPRHTVHQWGKRGCILPGCGTRRPRS